MVADVLRLPGRARTGAAAAGALGDRGDRRVHAIFLLSPPLALTDVFNYINYGRMEVVHHLNPYTTIPVLEPHSDPSFALSNWHQLLSPYGPLFTLLTFAVVPLGVAGSFWALKGILMLAEPGDDLAGVAVRATAGPRPAGGDRARGAEPDRARVGARRRPQRLPVIFCIMLGFYLMLLARARRRDVAPVAGPAGAASAAGAAGGTLVHRLRGWLSAISLLELGAGAAFVTATALKASGGVLIPVVLAGLCGRRGR